MQYVELWDGAFGTYPYNNPNVFNEALIYTGVKQVFEYGKKKIVVLIGVIVIQILVILYYIRGCVFPFGIY